MRSGGTVSVLSCEVKTPSTLGTFLRSFRWGHVRQLARVSRELLARAWAAGASPDDAPLTIDLDSTICETYDLAKEGARHHCYTGQRGYLPLFAVAAGTGEVLIARLRQGRANTARGAAHFLRETVSRVRYAGARGQLTMRADSGFYTHAVVSVYRKTYVRFSITVRQHKSLRNLTDAIPESDWRPITDREGDTLALEAGHRHHAEVENAIRDLRYGVGLNHLPSGRFFGNVAWLAAQIMARQLTLHLPRHWSWETQFVSALLRLWAMPLWLTTISPPGLLAKTHLTIRWSFSPSFNGQSAFVLSLRHGVLQQHWVSYASLARADCDG